MTWGVIDLSGTHLVKTRWDTISKQMVSELMWIMGHTASMY